MNREEFEKFCSSYGCTVQPEWKTFGLIVWQHQQEKIDELKANNFALSAMVCKHPDKRTLDENYDSIKNYCDVLKAENPDVPCPACGGSGYDKDEDFNDALGKCSYCNNGTVSKVKALQYEIEQLENKIKHLQDSAQKCIDTLSKYGI